MRGTLIYGFGEPPLRNGWWGWVGIIAVPFLWYQLSVFVNGVAMPWVFADLIVGTTGLAGFFLVSVCIGLVMGSEQVFLDYDERTVTWEKRSMGAVRRRVLPMGEGGQLVLDHVEADPKYDVPASWTIRYQHSQRSIAFQVYSVEEGALEVLDNLAEHMEVPVIDTRRGE